VRGFARNFICKFRPSSFCTLDKQHSLRKTYCNSMRELSYVRPSAVGIAFHLVAEPSSISHHITHQHPTICLLPGCFPIAIQAYFINQWKSKTPSRDGVSSTCVLSTLLQLDILSVVQKDYIMDAHSPHPR